MSFLAYALVGALIIPVASLGYEDKYPDFCVMAILITTTLLVPLVTSATDMMHHTIDNYLYLADSALGFNGFHLARWVWSTAWFGTALASVYNALPLATAVAWVIDRSATMVRALLFACAIGVGLYFVFPAIGPLKAFPGFPWVQPHAGWSSMYVNAPWPRNTFPSLHFGWALLLILNSRSRWALGLFAAFAVLTGVATIALGEHYMVDLIAAVPFTLCIQRLAERTNPKLRWI